MTAPVTRQHSVSYSSSVSEQARQSVSELMKISIPINISSSLHYIMFCSMLRFFYITYISHSRGVKFWSSWPQRSASEIIHRAILCVNRFTISYCHSGCNHIFKNKQNSRDVPPIGTSWIHPPLFSIYPHTTALSYPDQACRTSRRYSTSRCGPSRYWSPYNTTYLPPVPSQSASRNSPYNITARRFSSSCPPELTCCSSWRIAQWSYPPQFRLPCRTGRVVK